MMWFWIGMGLWAVLAAWAVATAGPPKGGDDG
jgi:hypothetical protein